MKTILACSLHICKYVADFLIKTILACSLHICDYVAVSSLYGITLLMLSFSEMPGLNSIVKVPFTCVCRTLYGPLILLPNLQGFHFFLSTLCWGDNVSGFLSYKIFIVD
jgi:hypothetical protein